MTLIRFLALLNYKYADLALVLPTLLGPDLSLRLKRKKEEKKGYMINVFGIKMDI